MTDFAGQPLARLADVLERLAVKQAAGSPSGLEDLRRELRLVMEDSVKPAPPPVVFRGKKQLAFEALLQGCTGTEAAERAGTNRTSVSRWLAGRDFKEALDRARAERVIVAQEGIADLLPLAVRRLRGILVDPAAAHRDIIAAAREVMDRAGMPKTEHIGAPREEESTDPRADLADRLAELPREVVAQLLRTAM